ncbi:flavodoxin domain-containing protein [Fusibacter sp. 3D3]|uniref:flavodoxin domain-containing protein n=1 Tax=Fusibacter sp. 3D3 TaxID=1048380 RepID=UPI000852A7F4|nr:flavodoxin domain-containing protein [Fusibacter sp. 3D3]GAU80006.1 hypothetical protein F3D3_4672 [Fusibacter sp. 3D3]
MKTLILYTTTYGLTKTMAEKLAEKITGDVDCINLMNQTQVDLKAYKHLIFGGSIYMGQIQKKMKQFCTENEREILEHPVSLFLCCGVNENFKTNLENAFPKRIIDHSKNKVSFGGLLNTDQMKFMHKTITKLMVKSSEKEGKALPKPNLDAIEGLAETLNADIA